MPDTDKSGAPDAAPADIPVAPPAVPESTSQPAEETMCQKTSPATAPNATTPATIPAAPPPGTFGSTRGSGLARGKRSTVPAASTSGGAPQPTYKPSALEVITQVSAYKNPFTGETSVGAPPVNEPAVRAADPALPIARSDAPAQAQAAEPAAAAPAAEPPKEDHGAVDAESKAELNILPPEPANRPAVRWEAPPGGASEPAGHRDDRPAFQPRERRDQRSFESRDGRERRDGRGYRDGGRDQRLDRERSDGGRREERTFEPRSNQPFQPKEPKPQAKPGGFIGWLKGLFGGGSAEPAATGGERHRDSSQDQGERRHRGGEAGRGRGGQGRGFRDENRGPRPEGHQGPGGGFQGDEGGHRRRRRRGGRGRQQDQGGSGGDRGPRPEGQQGGGAI